MSYFPPLIQMQAELDERRQVHQCALDFAIAQRHYLDFRQECDHILGRDAACQLHEKLKQIWYEAQAHAIEQQAITKEAEDKNRLNRAREALRRIKPPLWERVHRG